MPKYYEFQLYAVSAQALPSRVLRPPSLNYFGLLGPTGTGFGQLVYLVPEVLLEPRDWLDLELVLSGSQKDDGRGPTVDVQAIETDGQGDQLDISLTELPKTASDGAKGDADPASKGIHHLNIRYHWWYIFTLIFIMRCFFAALLPNCMYYIVLLYSI